MQPRIYTYKITFEEVPYWYWGVHKERRYNDGYMGSPVTHKWMWGFYTPRIQILEVFPYTDEGWREASEVERRLILPDLNNPLCLNERCGSALSIDSCKMGGSIGGKITGVLNVTSGHLLSICRDGGVAAGRQNAESGHCQRIARLGGLASGEKAAEKLNTTKWLCMVTGKISTKGPLTMYQKSLGIDPRLKARVDSLLSHQLPIILAGI